MDTQSVRFSAAYTELNQLPQTRLPEIAFVGRSNVGKSSLLNKLFNRKKLAKVSQTPGKTATINFFTSPQAIFVDLPGYGFAQVSKAEKAHWARLIEGYLLEKRNFALVVALIDIRHKPSELDVGMVQFLLDVGLPFMIVLTKADKLSKQQIIKQQHEIISYLDYDGDIPLLVTSSEKGTGIQQLRSAIDAAIRKMSRTK